jgi:tetratricopeptide (TPR) repeat protein
MILRRPEEAMPQIERAVELDPLNVITLSFRGVDLYCARRYDEAIAQARTAIRVQPGAPVASGALYGSLRQLKKYDEVVAIEKGGLSAFPSLMEAFARAYPKVGYARAWGLLAGEQAALYDKGMRALSIADSYMLGGDKDKAVDWLERVYQERNPNLPYLNCDPGWDSLRSYPRFQSLMRRMGLPQQ